MYAISKQERERGRERNSQTLLERNKERERESVASMYVFRRI